MGFLDGIIGNGKVQPLTETVAKRLVDGAKNKMDRVMLLIVINSGIGLDEILALRSSDVDFTANTVTIYGKTIRTIKLPGNVVTEIKQYLGEFNDERIVFPVSQRSVMMRMQSYQNGCPQKLNWRVLCHTYADLAIKKHVPLQTIANNVGVPMNVLLQAFPYYENGKAQEVPNLI